MFKGVTAMTKRKHSLCQTTAGKVNLVVLLHDSQSRQQQGQQNSLPRVHSDHWEPLFIHSPLPIVGKDLPSWGPVGSEQAGA